MTMCSKKMMSIELKREIIEKNEQGVRVSDLARQYGRSTSTISTVLKQKESIKGITLAKGVTIISKLRSSLHEKMEELLMVWMTEKQLQGDTLTPGIICEKARAIYGDLQNQTPRTSTDEASEDSFKASRGWFVNFLKRIGIHSDVRHGEAASSDEKAAEDYFKAFSELIEVDGYVPHLSCVEMKEINCERLIELVRERENVWNHDHPAYSDRVKLMKSWEEIAQIFGNGSRLNRENSIDDSGMGTDRGVPGGTPTTPTTPVSAGLLTPPPPVVTDDDKEAVAGMINQAVEEAENTFAAKILDDALQKLNKADEELEQEMDKMINEDEEAPAEEDGSGEAQEDKTEETQEEKADETEEAKPSSGKSTASTKDATEEEPEASGETQNKEDSKDDDDKKE